MQSKVSLLKKKINPAFTRLVEPSVARENMKNVGWAFYISYSFSFSGW